MPKNVLLLCAHLKLIDWKLAVRQNTQRKIKENDDDLFSECCKPAS